MIRRTIAAIGTAALLTLSLAGCSSGSVTGVTTAGDACTPTPSGGPAAITIKDFEFSPNQLAAKVGDDIQFSNAGPTDHTATLDVGPCTTPHIPAGGQSGLKFTAAGTYTFHCAIHPSMKGTIVVS